ncbi:9922_t:CDS:2 [Scutellospora calospora]|uniref:9922_t:CDS:1 n=1 Tax=Scutellospora calospora TaxID=85575 RepID=A0ACA9LSB4_9GLOM|nr:9922_t:CDS:2 [Scutellospora calospora]
MNCFCREKFIWKIDNVSFRRPNVTTQLITNTPLIQPIRQTQQTYNEDATKISSLMSLANFSILIVVISIILRFAFFYQPFFEIFFPPLDWPIFRSLTNTTNLISGQLAELNIPASSVIIEYRVTSQYLADIIDRNELSQNNSDNVAQYLNQLGDKIRYSGEAIEKMYPVGRRALKELGMELKDINNKIKPGQVLTQENVTYFVERYGKILNVVTNLRDKFQLILNELDDLYILYNGTHHQLANGMNDVVFFFEKITPELEEYYDMEQLKRDLGYLKQIMEKVPNIRYQINRLLSEFNNHRQMLIRYRNEWVSSWRRKLVSFEDTEELQDMIPRLNNLAEVFIKKDYENIEKRIYV